MSKYLDTRTDEGEPPAIRRSGIDCAEASDLIPALALGAIETGEQLALRLHCQTCPDCTELLDASRRVVDYLPFAAPGKTPPDRAKHALFARIAEAQPASAVSSQSFSTITPIDALIVDSPAAKRRSAPQADPVTLPVSEPGNTSRPINLLSNRMGRLAAGPLALALVLVTIYSLQGLDFPLGEAVNPTPTPGQAAEADSNIAANTTFVGTDLEQANDSAPNAVLGDPDPAEADTGYTVDTYDTRGASTAGPLLQQYANNSSGMFVYKAVSTGQTELLGTVAPNFADCSVVQRDTGTYELTVSGVRLPGGAGAAGVYLVTYEGERIYVTDVVIDARGDGKVTFETERPLDAFRSLEIGMARQAMSAASSDPLTNTVIFSLSTTEVLRGLALTS